MTYSYQAINQNGEIVKGEILAVDKSEALKRINSTKLIPIEIKESVKGTLFKKINIFKSKKVKKEELMVFTRELSVMLKAGLPILRALKISIESNKERKLGEILENIYEELKKGESLASSLGMEKKYFSDFFINMVKTGERSGRLPEVLMNISKDLENSIFVSSEVKNALAYPVFLLLMSGFALFFIFSFVVPKFTIIIENLDVELPFYSKIVLGFGTFMKKNLYLVLTLFLGIIYLLFILRKNEKFKYLLNRFIFSLPVLNKLLVEIELSRFSHAFSILLKSGIEIINSIKMSIDSIGNLFLRKKFSEVPTSLKRGKSLHYSIEDIDVFPKIAVHMIEVGEETGKLPDLLEEISTLFMEKFRNSMKRFISLLEPIIITIMGVIIGFIVISLLSAIMSLNEIRF